MRRHGLIAFSVAFAGALSACDSERGSGYSFVSGIAGASGGAGTTGAAGAGGTTGAGGTRPDPRASDAFARPGVGCGRPLPLDQPVPGPVAFTRYKHYRVMATGANLTDANAPEKAGPRTFWVRVPASYDPNRPYRVVHLLSACATYESANTATFALYDEAMGGDDDAIYVAADVPEGGALANCYDSDDLRSQEWEAFQLIQQTVDERYCTDLNRVYVVGRSSGGRVANMWGCYYAGGPDPSRKFAPQYHVRGEIVVGAAEPPEQPTCGGPVAALFVDGKIFQTDAPPAESLAALTRVGRMNGCDTTYQNLSGQAVWHDEVAAIGSACKRFTTCPSAYPVVFCTSPEGTRYGQDARVIPAAKLFFDEIEANPVPNPAPDGGVDAGDASFDDAGDAAPEASACRPELPTTCGGGCVSLLSDDRNCGACGHVCAEATTCSAGTCSAPTTLVHQIDLAPGGMCAVASLALADGTLYWADRLSGRIMSVPSSGGTPRVLATGQEQAAAIAARGGRVFWRIWPDPTSLSPISAPAIRTMPAQGGPVTTVYEANVTYQLTSFGASADGEAVYLGAGATGLLKVAATGGAPQPLTTDTFALPATVTVEGTKLVVAGQNEVDAIDLLEGTSFASCFGAGGRVRCTQLARGQGALRESIGIKDGRVYWADAEHIAVNDLVTSPAVYVPYSIVTTVGGPIGAMILGPDAVYFSVLRDPSAGAQGDWIGKAALAPGSPAVRIARSPGGTGSIVTDGARLYWLGATCAIMSTTL